MMSTDEYCDVADVLWHSPEIFELQLEKNGMQYVSGDCVALFGEDQKVSRPYSMASGVGEKVLRFVVRRMDGGQVSPWLASRKRGDRVKISPPFGWFRPGPKNDGQKFVFLATGTGISPFLSHFRSCPEHPPLQCLYGVRQLQDAVDLEWLRAACHVRLAVSREDVDGHLRGRVTDMLDDMPCAPDIHYYLCGLDDMIDEVSNWLENKSVPITHIHRECFFNSSYSA